MAEEESHLAAFKRSVIFDPDEKRRDALAEMEKRVHELVAEDLQKDIPDLLADIHRESLKNKGIAVSPNTRTMARIATLLSALYLKAEIQTRRVVRLTWALVGLTAALLFFTVYLAEDAYFKHQREQQAHKVSERDANKEALDQVEKATESEPVFGEELLESEELRQQLREAKERESARPKPERE